MSKWQRRIVRSVMWGSRSRTVASVGAFFVLVAVSFSQVDPRLVEGLKWRSIGPFRGGRSVAVAGSVQRPKEYFFGATGGGLWKTTDGGDSWGCVSDGFFKTASVGAVTIAPSNPDVVYVGMGEKDIRGNISHGDGMYKSTDAGKTWTHIGLEETQTISKIVVHPTNPDLVYVAALGHVYGPNNERGVYRSDDGGKTWKRILFESNKAGAIDLSMDPNHPEVLFAATWEAWRTPYTLNSGGPGSKLWKSTDGGANWKDISRNPGLPKGVLGKIGVSVSPADAKRVYAIVEALDGGVFKSDDSGATWTLMNEDRNWRQRAWYYTHIFADPKTADTVYVLNVGAGRSTNGGKTFSGLSTQHSDNHDLWIAPDNPQRMIESNDGGASVTTDGGRNWTEQNVPTAQFYHVSTDNAVPYHILGAQQDNSTVRILSRAPGGGIGKAHWTSTAGGESGYVVALPSDPDIVLGGSYGGVLEVQNHRTGENRDVNVWPDNPMGHGAANLKQRLQWTFPIVISPHQPETIYTCSQYILKTTNRGQTWKAISPDLTRNDKSTQGSSGGPITKDNTSVEYYGTVFTVAESPLRPGVIWAGSDDGLIHVTRDGGGYWANVTPPRMPKWGLVSLIEASPHDPAVAYAAVDNHENDDYAPYVYRTSDYGRTWSLIVGGLPKDTFARAVREDPIQTGLLYLGTETGVFVSFDSGEHWQPLQSNLPLTPVHDLVIKDDDLVVATHGRSFWVLDDISPLRQAAAAADKKAFLYQPRDAFRNFSGGGGFGGRRGRNEPVEPMGDNPLSGIVVTYVLKEKAEKLKFEFVDDEGNVVRTLDGNGEPGTHRFATSLSYPSYKNIPGVIMWAAGARPLSAPPGTYSVRMIIGDDTQTRWFKLKNDPRSSASEADTRAQFEFAKRVSDRVTDAHNALIVIRDVRTKAQAAADKAKGDKAIGDASKSLIAGLEAVEREIYETRMKSGQDPLNYPIKLNNKIAALLGVVLSGDFRPTDQCGEVFAELSAELQVQLDKLDVMLHTELAKLNAELAAKKLDAIKPIDPNTVQSSGGGGRGGFDPDEGGDGEGDAGGLPNHRAA